MYIDTQEALLGFVERAASSKVLAVDTEFLREKTFYARLCLLQLATDNEVAIVDPFKVTDLTVLNPLFTSPTIVKLFHAANQDLEIIHRELGIMPTPIFDTQIAATLLGYTQQIGYAALVSSECGVQLKKAESYTDWSRRPLAPSQIKYAADDVIYLPKIYHNMYARLTKAKRLSWLDADFADLTNPERFHPDPRERFRRLKRGNCLNRQQLSAAREAAAWRELLAQKRNVPRKWILTDEQIVEACKREPRTIDDLFMVRGLRERLSTKDARNMLNAMIKGFDAPEEEWPELSKGNRNEKNVDTQVDLMLSLVRLRARQNDVAMQTLASHDELAKIARGYRDDVDLLKGWRKAIIGDELIELLEGRIALSLDGGTLVVTRKDAQ